MTIGRSLPRVVGTNSGNRSPYRRCQGDTVFFVPSLVLASRFEIASKS